MSSDIAVDTVLAISVSSRLSPSTPWLPASPSPRLSLDGCRPLVHSPGRQGSEERWHELCPHRSLHHPSFRDRLHDHLPRVHSRQEAGAPVYAVTR